MNRMCFSVITAVLLFMVPLHSFGQDEGAAPQGADTVLTPEVLTLEQCRELAIAGNDALAQEKVRMQMAGYDKKIALANYFPNITANGAYVHNGDNIALLSGEQSQMLSSMGTAAQGALNATAEQLAKAVIANPGALSELLNSQMWQTVIGTLAQTDISGALNSLGSQISDALYLDVSNVGGAAISLQQPVFVGGKIVASNKIAQLAEQLAKSRYDEKYSQTIVDVDNAYWQVVSISAKKELAEQYSSLLREMLVDAQAAVDEGVATEADILSVKVKANEAAMLETRAVNGLRLSKMLLCKLIGLPLEEPIMLADEGTSLMSRPQVAERKSMEEISDTRPELQQLRLAEQIYDKKVVTTRAAMMPTIALTANYLYTNPNLKDGFRNTWSGTWNAGVMVSIPIIHGTEALQKTRKAKAEASLYRLKYEEAQKMVNLQVSQLRYQYDEAMERMAMAESNMASAEENLRTATLGFEEGVVPANVTMAAQAAWLKAHSEYIDSGIELQMIATNINKAEGNIL